MYISLIDQVRFPKFAFYVYRDLPAVAKVASIRRAFQKYGQLDHAGLKRALKWRERPTIDIKTLTAAYGSFSPGVGSNIIEIDTDLIRRFEAGRDWVFNKGGGKVHLAGATVLHELIHWADDQDGKDYRGEEGELFEKAVYGKVLG
jgi:hypothetical protein